MSDEPPEIPKEHADYYWKLRATLDEGVLIMSPSSLAGMVVTTLMKLPERHASTVEMMAGAIIGGLVHNVRNGRLSREMLMGIMMKILSNVKGSGS